MATQTINGYTAAVSIDPINDQLLIYNAGLGAYRKINRNTFLGVSGTPADISTVQSFTNKTIGNTNTITVKDSSFTLQDDTDVTKQAQFQLSGITTGTTRTYTLPNATGTLADIASTQTLTNKTLTSPTITGGTIDNTTITVDSISGHTTSTLVTVGGVQMNNGTIGTAGAVTSTSIAVGAVQPQALVSGAGTGWSWQTFTPTFTNLVVGNGTLNARYTQIGKMVWVFLTFIYGSTSGVGTDPNFPPPVAASSLYTTLGVNSVVGFGNITGGTVTAVAAPFFNASNAAIHLGYFAPSATSNGLSATTASQPGTWAVGSIMIYTCLYEAA